MCGSTARVPGRAAPLGRVLWLAHMRGDQSRAPRVRTPELPSQIDKETASPPATLEVHTPDNEGAGAQATLEVHTPYLHPRSCMRAVAQHARGASHDVPTLRAGVHLPRSSLTAHNARGSFIPHAYSAPIVPLLPRLARTGCRGASSADAYACYTRRGVV